MSSIHHAGPAYGFKQQKKKSQKSPNTGCAGRCCETLMGCWVSDVMSVVADLYIGVLDSWSYGGFVLVNGVADVAKLPPYVGFVVDLVGTRRIWAQRCSLNKHYLNTKKICADKR